MILTKEITIKLNRGNIPFYKQHDEYKKYKIGDIIDVPLEHCSKDHKILVKCDICGKEQEILYSTYWDSTKKGTQIYCCKSKCANIKREETNMKLYGVKNCFQNEEMKEKMKNTMFEKYGVDHNMKNLEIREKCIETWRKNYGCDNPTQNHDILIKSFTKGNKIKLYKDTNIYYQGSYELDFLDKFYNIIKIERGFSIKYKMEGKGKVYHPDFFLSEFNTIIEIKSSYWFKKFEKRIFYQKEEIVKNYNYLIIINKNYDEFDQFIKNQKSA